MLCPTAFKEDATRPARGRAAKADKEAAAAASATAADGTEPTASSAAPLGARSAVEFLAEEVVAGALAAEPDLRADAAELRRLRTACKADAAHRWKGMDEEERKPYQDKAAGQRGGCVGRGRVWGNWSLKWSWMSGAWLVIRASICVALCKATAFCGTRFTPRSPLAGLAAAFSPF